MSTVTKWKSNLLVAMLQGFINPIWEVDTPTCTGFSCFSFTSFFSSFLNQVRRTWLEEMERISEQTIIYQFFPINLMNIERNGYKDTTFWYTMVQQDRWTPSQPKHRSWSDSLHHFSDWWLVPRPQRMLHGTAISISVLVSNPTLNVTECNIFQEYRSNHIGAL